jgi:hypothetical protein
MPPVPERAPMTTAAQVRIFIVIALSALGFGLTLYVFYPGVMTYDARYIYGDIAKHFLGDWQSPVMAVFWALIDPIAPGPGSIFLATAAIYWLAFALIGVALARYSVAALLLPILALSPPSFVLVGIIWRDVLFAATWLLAAALVFSVAESGAGRRWAQGFALLLLVFGVLLRPNSVPAAPVLTAYIFWPAGRTFKRTALLYVQAFLAFVALVPAVYYGVLGAKRQNPLHQIFVFDLAGISFFTKQNQFPVTWSDSETALLYSSECYQADQWDRYWTLKPCDFVMAKLEGEKIFGTSVLADAWQRAVTEHPSAYLRHRLAFMRTFLFGSNLVMWTTDITNTERIVFSERPEFMRLVALHDTLRPTLLFRQGTWLLLCAGLAILALWRRDTPAGAFVLGVCGSAVLYVATYFFVGVASDYRYSYWAVLAGLSGSVILLVRLLNSRKVVKPPRPS